jgi:tRNA-specific 2-thiouridylase
VVGHHEGVASFTVGQRRGVRVAMGVPVYVTDIDADANVVIVGTKRSLLRIGLVAGRVCWHIDEPAAPIRADVQIRYAHTAAPATVERIGDGQAKVIFDTPQPAITPGQATVFYADDTVVGGGWIERSLDT